jgi:hypothetical protein
VRLVRELSLETGPAALGGGVVPAVAPAAHARHVLAGPPMRVVPDPATVRFGHDELEAKQVWRHREPLRRALEPPRQIELVSIDRAVWQWALGPAVLRTRKAPGGCERLPQRRLLGVSTLAMPTRAGGPGPLSAMESDHSTHESRHEKPRASAISAASPHPPSYSACSLEQFRLPSHLSARWWNVPETEVALIPQGNANGIQNCRHRVTSNLARRD